jgi:hypothetical protein
MLLGFNGGRLGKNNDPLPGSATGVWTLNEQINIRRQGLWPVAGDPFFSNVSLLLHCDGTNGSTTIVDSSGSPKTVTAVGNAQISTAQSKFGGASLLFDGNGDAATIPNTNNAFTFSTNTYTFECFIRPVALSSFKILLDVSATAGNFFGTLYLAHNGTTLVWGTRPNTGSQYAYVEATGGTLTTNTWQHVALSVNAGAAKAFINGVAVGSPITFSTPAYTPVGFGVGQFSNLLSAEYSFNGYIDEVRITNGVARYTANFTAPTAPFPGQ